MMLWENKKLRSDSYDLGTLAIVPDLTWNNHSFFIFTFFGLVNL